MIVVRVEIWPGGDESRKTEVGRVEIARRTEEASEVADYILHAKSSDQLGPVNKSDEITDYPRAKGAMHLVAIAMAVLFGDVP